MKKLFLYMFLVLMVCNVGSADETSDIKLVQEYKDKLFESAIKSDLNQVEKICTQYKKDKAENVIIDLENSLNWLCSGGLRPIFMDITYEYNKKFFNEKLSHIDICNEYKKLPIDASGYDQMSLNTHMGINNHCKTVEIKSKFKQDAKHNLIKNLDIEKLNFNFLTNKYYSLLIPEEEVTKKSTCHLNLEKEERLDYLKIKERCGVKNITYQEESLSGAAGELDTFELTSERDLTSGWIIITDYFYADANKDDYMDLIIRFKNDGSYSMGANTMTTVITSLSENKYQNINFWHSSWVIESALPEIKSPQVPKKYPTIACTVFEVNGKVASSETGKIYSFNLNDEIIVETSNSLIKYEWKNSNYFISASYNRISKVNTIIGYSDPERKVIAITTKLNCEEE